MVLRVLLVITTLCVGLTLVGCGKKPAAPSEMETICEGPPLRTVERRNQAMEDGLDINKRYDCVTKESWAAMQEQRKRYEANNAPQEVTPVNVSLVDVNSATQDEIGVVITISRETAAHIVFERNLRRFKDWPDLQQRVKALRDAEAAVAASTCGLVVDGKSLEGVPPNGLAAARLRETYRDYNRR